MNFSNHSPRERLISQLCIATNSCEWSREVLCLVLQRLGQSTVTEAAVVELVDAGLTGSNAFWLTYNTPWDDKTFGIRVAESAQLPSNEFPYSPASFQGSSRKAFAFNVVDYFLGVPHDRQSRHVETVDRGVYWLAIAV